MALTDSAIRNTKPATKPIKLSDGEGMYLLLNPNGSRWWRFDYRFAEKRKTLSLGTYPEARAREARRRAQTARQRNRSEREAASREGRCRRYVREHRARVVLEVRARLGEGPRRQI